MNGDLNGNRAEWLEADGLGGFASGTVCGLRTRCYHAILLNATTPPSGRMVLVNGFDAQLETSAGEKFLSTQRYAPGTTTPGALLENFTTEPWPQWTFLLADDRRIVQELFVPHGYSAVILRWRLEGAVAGPCNLRILPFFSGRDFGATHHENRSFNFVPHDTSTGQTWNFYAGVPAVRARSNGSYQHQPCWYRNFLYDEEVERGLDAVEDLAAPGIYTFDLNAGCAVLIFSAGAEFGDVSRSAEELADDWAEKEKTRRASFSSPRLRSANAYLVQRGTGKTIIAGYPWFADWGRDTFISLRGLCLATGNWRDARDILVPWAGTISQGMLPNRFPDYGDQPEYNSVDASLWYVLVVHEFLAAAPDYPGRDDDTRLLLGAVENILTGYRDGTRYGIRADSDGLLACGVPGQQLTWMDAKVDDWVVTPRIGKPVEIQALWLNALGHAAQRAAHWQSEYDRGRASFEQRFWNESRECLYDVVDVDHQPGTVDARIRPNQIFAVGGLPISFFDCEQAAQVVATVQAQLWTPLGPRSLAPGENDYAPHYLGDRLARDGAYHQGTVWPWLTGPFLEAFIRVHGGTHEAKAEARRLLEDSELLRLDLQGLNHVPEIADAESPFTARGCPFQAWSVAEILRLELKIIRP
jgi:predicted glycogen debranching enzyme